MKLLTSKDFMSGVMLLAIGLVALVIGQSYRIGTASEMGPGYFPVILAVGLIGLGAILVFNAWRAQEPEQIETGRWKAVVFPTLAMIVFALTLDRFGLVISLILLLVIGVLGSDQTRWKEIPFLLAGAIAFAVIVFVYGVGLQVRVWPA